MQQVVLAHRVADSLGAILEDMTGILLNRMSPHREAFVSVADAINLKSVSYINSESLTL
jgi:hypothetical protein